MASLTSDAEWERILGTERGVMFLMKALEEMTKVNEEEGAKAIRACVAELHTAMPNRFPVTYNT